MVNKHVRRGSGSLFDDVWGVRGALRHRLSLLEPRRCSVESLEDRYMLSVDASLSCSASVTDTIVQEYLNQLTSWSPFVSEPVEAANARAVELALEQASDLSQYSQQEMDEATSWVLHTVSPVTEEELALQFSTQTVVSFSSIPNTYVIETGSNTSQDLISQFESDAMVDYFYPLVPIQYELYSLPNDPYFTNQWHLQNTGQQLTPSDPFPIFAVWGADARVVPAWDTATGEGVVIGIVDNGLQYSHSDLAPNYESSLSYDFNGYDSNPMADPANGDFHGTSVAGIAAASGNNSVGIAGVAYDAALAGLRLMAGPVTDLQISEALTWKMEPDIDNDNKSIDIYNNSWGFTDEVRAVMGPGPLALQALIDSVSFGRNGLGTIHVFAAGNGDGIGDSVNYNGFANHRYTIAVGAYDYTGAATDYSEGGAAILVVAPSGGDDVGILTTDLMGDNGYNAEGYLNDPDGRDYFPDVNYTSTFTGTSASTAIVSGVIALMLEANPNLTYRDVEHILARSARQINPSESAWIQNGNPLFYDPWTDMDGLPFDPETREVYASPDLFFPGSALKPIPSDGPPFAEQHSPTDNFLLNGAGFTTHSYYGHGAVDAALAVELAQSWPSRNSALPERVWTLCDT